jgi:hypothetical protein
MIRTMKTITKIGILSIFAISLMNCTGEKGAIGPQGVAGQQGAKGDKGDPGASGEFPKSQTGSFTIKVADWKNPYTEYFAEAPVSAITKEVIDKGIISVWWVSSTTSQFQLPLDRNVDKILPTFLFEKGGRIRINILPGINIAAPAKPTTDMTFRWVIN